MWLYDYEERMKESKAIAELIGIQGPNYILEIGSGSGHLSHYLTKNGNTVFATNAEDDRLKDCHLDPYVKPVYWKYEGLGTNINILQRYGLYDYIIANGNAMHSESGGEISKEEDYEYLVKGLLKITKPGGEIWLGFNPALGSNFMKQYEIETPGNLIGTTVYKIVRSQ